MGKDSGNQSSPGSSGSSSHPRQTYDSQGGTPTKKAKLVSYIDPDAGLSDDERYSVPMDLESDDEDKEYGIDAMIELDEKERSHCMEELWEGGVKLPLYKIICMIVCKFKRICICSRNLIYPLNF